MQAIIIFLRDTLGNTVTLPIVVTVLGLILGMRWTRALRSGVVVGVGFIAIGLVVNLLLDSLGPAAFAMTERLGLQLNTIDLGFAPAAAIALGTLVGAGIVPFVFLLNIIMLLTRMTKTLNVDIWNYWHYALSGSMVYFITGNNFWAGVLAAMIHAIFSLLIADAAAPKIQEFFDLPGVSVPHGWATTSIPIIWGMNWLFDRIPGINKIDIDMKKMQERIGVFGEPIILGLIIGVIMGIFAKQDVAGILKLAMSLAGAMFLFPRMVAILMEGLLPLTEGAHKFFNKRLKGREAYVGLDSALLLGYPGTILLGVLLIPITLILAAALPGNTTLPFADLSATAFFIPMCAPLMRGNLFRGLITGTVIISMVLLISSIFAPAITLFAAEAGYVLPAEAAGAQYITGLSAGNPVALILYWVGELGATISLGILFVIAFAVATTIGIRRNLKERQGTGTNIGA
ncbi:PTS transporter subunit IIC [Bacillus sp. FJAT-50079]|uniref:PTS galactitol transporter subunit IIC n=1 Tax=Bacillus sp. FJAT-50079 TaxID=2833577 RepID=UPI001BC98C4C|nr:PTS transporter subunit IIC [Bacillus sp. FJAT-50079]MBS4207887.1 PTS galactitol transporter subunit IIC [Bacillus sp. FJAT-50079]